MIISNKVVDRVGSSKGKLLCKCKLFILQKQWNKEKIKSVYRWSGEKKLYKAFCVWNVLKWLSQHLLGVKTTSLKIKKIWKFEMWAYQTSVARFSSLLQARGYIIHYKHCTMHNWNWVAMWVCRICGIKKIRYFWFCCIDFDPLF